MNTRDRIAQIRRNPILQLTQYGPRSREAQTALERRQPFAADIDAARSRVTMSQGQVIAADLTHYMAMASSPAQDQVIAATLSDGWTPAQLSGSVWLEGDDSGLSFSGFTWPNPGTAADFSEATNKPTAGLIGARQAVDFTATQRAGAGASSWAAVTNGSEWYVFGVFLLDTNRTAATVKDGTAVPLIGSSAGGGGVYLYYDGSVMKIFAHQYNNATADKVTPTADAQTTVSLGVAHYFEARLNDTTMACRLDGNTEQTVAVTAGQQNTNGIAEVGLHTRSLTGLDGKVGALYYTPSTPSAAHIAGARTYLAGRWGVTTP